MHIKLKRSPGIYLAGFMGSGKSTVGAALANQIGWDFVDLDAEIEQEEGEKISAIFDRRGETEFRRIEREAIRRRVRRIECGCPTVVALGGGEEPSRRFYVVLFGAPAMAVAQAQAHHAAVAARLPR